jgi:hypothetical protein
MHLCWAASDSYWFLRGPGSQKVPNQPSEVCIESNSFYVPFSYRFVPFRLALGKAKEEACIHALMRASAILEKVVKAHVLNLEYHIQP